jgi:hypothetical protein
MTRVQGKGEVIDIKALLGQDTDFLRSVMKAALGHAGLAAVKDASRRRSRWPLAIPDPRSARRRGISRPGRGNGGQPNQETSFHMPIVDFAELDAHSLLCQKLRYLR